MKAFFMYLLCILVIGLFSIPVANAQLKTSIDSIAVNPGHYVNNAVEVEGLVTQYVAGTSTTTSYYVIQGYYSNIIQVNTAESAPVTNEKYRVVGIVYVDPATGTAFISEKSKTRLNDIIIIDGRKWYEDPLVLSLIGFVVLLIAFLIYFLVRRKRDDEYARPAGYQIDNAVPPVYQSVAEPPRKATGAEFETVKIQAGSPKTMKFIPGQLVIVSGDDKGKSFRIAGFPTHEGHIVTIGREAVDGERSFAHIQIDNKFQTVSRKQAEIISTNGHLYVRNISQTNLTKVDGADLQAGEKVELKPNSVIQTGELSFQYVLTV